MTLRGMTSGAKAETRADYGSSMDYWMISRQPTGPTVRPDAEGQAFEETMNKAVRRRGTADFLLFTFQQAMSSNAVWLHQQTWKRNVTIDDASLVGRSTDFIQVINY
tara:strand:+ start:299 stop:619 length:321 start_codon:yes stop_codon:yes gene_type:complete